MAEIEIRTTGELPLFSEVVGRIAWERPFIESDLAGFYDEFVDAYCCNCDETEDEIAHLEDERDKLITERDALRGQFDELESKIKKRGIIL